VIDVAERLQLRSIVLTRCAAIPLCNVANGRVEDGRGSLGPMANAPFPIPSTPVMVMAICHSEDARRRRVSSRGPDRRNFNSALLLFRRGASASPAPRQTLGTENPLVDSFTGGFSLAIIGSSTTLPAFHGSQSIPLRCRLPLQDQLTELFSHRRPQLPEPPKASLMAATKLP
jgi:hypothetical protein